ncbi:MAG: PilZ domain-containing protein [Candidatus Omnitrophica bacterium]|nr:PilZ domain-containing protein [Candidatus Omnitrophota bacterium]
MEERRKFPRLKYPCKLILGGEDKVYSLHTENISAGGLRVILEKKLAINTPLSIELGLGLKDIKCKGRVVWVIDIKSPPIEKADLFDTGIEFTQIEPQDRETLRELIERILKSS